MSDERPDTENTDDVVCPYCGREFQDSWEFGHYAEDLDVECECGKTFSLTAHVSVTYTTTRKPCDGECRWGEAQAYHYDEEWIRSHHAENPRAYQLDEPNTLWLRECLDCDETEAKKVEFNGPCPWVKEAA